jgi:hypothetical protein
MSDRLELLYSIRNKIILLKIMAKDPAMLCILIRMNNQLEELLGNEQDCF